MKIISFDDLAMKGKEQEKTSDVKSIKGIEQDAVNTFTKYISPDAAKPIPITEAMRNDIIAKICGEDGQVDPNCFVLAQSIVFSAMEQEHFSEFLRSHHFCKYQIEVLTSGTVYLADILFCESALFYFSEYMEKEDAVNILQFWLAADNFQSQLAAKKGQYDGQEAQNDAMILYDKYFSLQATHPLGFDDVVRLEIESNICREGGPLPNCFTTPLRQAWTTMEKVFLPGFLSSNLYYKYLNDLIHSVRGDEFLGGTVSLTAHGSVGPPDDSHPGGSDSSAAQSSMKKASVKILKNFDEAIIVDAASLDPESLKMTFGRVSDLGQFIRESEPEPDVKKSKGFMFSQAMKKWVQGNTDEAQEELAWKIAKMIVSDVMQQAQYDQPLEKSTKNGARAPWQSSFTEALMWKEASRQIGKQALGWEEAGKTLNLDRLSFLCYELGSVQLVAFLHSVFRRAPPRRLHHCSLVVTCVREHRPGQLGPLGLWWARKVPRKSGLKFSSEKAGNCQGADRIVVTGISPDF
ncbi:hypothetical protein GH733_018772, partial [Mirounga leonina]